MVPHGRLRPRGLPRCRPALGGGIGALGRASELQQAGPEPDRTRGLARSGPPELSALRQPGLLALSYRPVTSPSEAHG